MSSINFRPASRSRFALTDRETARYSIARAILAAADENEGGLYRSNCFELEISAEIERTLPPSAKRHGGIFVPYSLAIDPKAVRVGLDTQTTTKGKELVFTEPGPFIEFLYNRMVVRQLGAEVLDGLVGNLGLPKQTGAASGAWIAENFGLDATDSNLTLAQVPMSLHTFCATTSFSRQLLAQSTPKIDGIVSLDLAKISALALDKAALVGDGTGNSPVGIMSTVGVQAYTSHSDVGNGAIPDYQDICAMVQLIEAANADTLMDFGWVTTSPIKARLKQTARSTGITLPIWQGDELDDRPAYPTNQLPKNQTHGTGTNLSPIIYGAWESIAIGLWGSGFEIVVDPYRLKKQGMIELTSFLLCDVGVRQPAALIYAKYCAAS